MPPELAPTDSVTKHRIERAGSDDVSLVIDHAAQPHAECPESQCVPTRSVVQAVMMVAVKRRPYSEGTGEIVDHAPSMRVTTRGLVGDKDVSALDDELFEDIRIDRTSVASCWA